MNKIAVSKYVLIWSMVISVLVLLASIYGLLAPDIYAKETANWATQAKGQDIGNLIAILTLLASGYYYKKGSSKAALIWLGTLFYLIYAYIVYSVAVHFNALFLVYVAILGICSYVVLLSIDEIKKLNSKNGKSAAVKFASYTIMGIGILFGLLWLSEIIPALITGKVPQSLQDAGLWVNPIHVIDLSIVLPGFIIAGYCGLKNKSGGIFYVAPWLAFSALMGLSIVAAMLLMITEGANNVLPPMIMVSIVVISSIVALWRYLSKIN
jgi:hypothetical protein